ncbi:DUF4249 domain-containing protein [Hymenobacter sp. BT664]|uniref:DUF4249 domain-containing protein n=1 Tax=Hymenobacter montanus TaxID=2771359 RepID=A0A927BBG3_9BACT|nr:DUF4249 domain-containing protein [Hymenobacter montanus]MBD2766948.1 DUF4249 domain-containing protein [Hymenobacter montanus]
MNLLRLNHGFLLLLTVIGGLVTGCETSVNVPAPAHTPSVSLQYLLRNEPMVDQYSGSEGWLYVGASQGVFSLQDDLGRDDATVTIVDQTGQTIEEFQPVAPPTSPYYGLGRRGFYRPERKLRAQPGQTYTLRARVPGLEPVEGKLTMPFPTVVESASLTPLPSSTRAPGRTRARLSVTIQDNAATTDYYMATARLLDAQGNYGPFWGVDPDFTSPDNPIKVGGLQLTTSFSDDANIFPYADTDVNGQRFTFASNVLYDKDKCDRNQRCPAYMEVTISTLTQDAYRFLLSKRRYLDNKENPFTEPAPVYSNIQSGFGVFGGAHNVTYRIPLP